MSADRDLATAIHHELISPESVARALDLWHHRTVGSSDRADLWRVLALTSSAAIEAVLARRLREAARTGPWDGTVELTEPLTGDTKVVDKRTGRIIATKRGEP